MMESNCFRNLKLSETSFFWELPQLLNKDQRCKGTISSNVPFLALLFSAVIYYEKNILASISRHFSRLVCQFWLRQLRRLTSLFTLMMNCKRPALDNSRVLCAIFLIWNFGEKPSGVTWVSKSSKKMLNFHFTITFTIF